MKGSVSRRIILGLLCLVWMQSIFAELNLSKLHEKTISNLYTRIDAEQKRDMALIKRLESIKHTNHAMLEKIRHETVDKQEIDKAHFEYSVALADVVSTKQHLEEALSEKDELEHELKRARVNLQEVQLTEGNTELPIKTERLEATVAFLSALIEAQSRLVNILKDSVSHKQSLVAEQEAFHRALLHEFNNQQNELREHYIASLNRHIQSQQSKWLQELSEKASALENPELSHQEHVKLELDILNVEEAIALSSYTLKVAKLHDRLEDVSDYLVHAMTVQSLDGYAHKVIRIKEDLLYQLKLMESKEEMLGKKEAIQEQYFQDGEISPKELEARLAVLEQTNKQYKNLAESIHKNLERVKDIQVGISKKMASAISRRQGLPGFDLTAWQHLGWSVALVPVQSYDLIYNLFKHVRLNLHAEDLSTVILACSVPWLLLLLSIVIRHYCDIFILALASSRHRLTSNMLYALLQFLRRNLWGLYLFWAICFSLYALYVPYHIYHFIVLMALVWFTYRLISLIARLFLVETISDVAGADVRLFRRLNRTLIIGALITALSLMAKEMKVGYDAQDLISRLLMVFMFVVAAVLLWGHTLLPNLLKTTIDTKRHYMLKAVSLLAFLIPLNVLIIAIVGLVGYVQLAWRMSYYQMIFVFVFTVYVIVRGVVTDLMDFCSEYVIRNFRNGWLISEACLKPLDRILRLIMMFLALLLLFQLFELDKNERVIEHLSTFVFYPFISFKGGQISILSLFEFGILLSIVIWATRWSREFSYRLLFKDMRDQGLRKSFATFFQYAVGMFGLMPTLWILGIDFTGLGMILSALAIGIGFGLRDFANNLVSGILLLMERPVKEGDIVSIGGYDGYVTHIGMRSMTVQSWEHVEVMVPNSEAFNKTFTNWTYNDGVVRTNVSIKLHRHDDPFYAQSLIADVLSHIEEVLPDPEYQVLLKEINDVLIEFDVRYFIDVTQYSRMVTRSKVLFAIWQRFKACGIKPPYPQQDIKLLEDKSDQTDKKQS